MIVHPICIPNSLRISHRENGSFEVLSLQSKHQSDQNCRLFGGRPKKGGGPDTKKKMKARRVGTRWVGLTGWGPEGWVVPKGGGPDGDLSNATGLNNAQIRHRKVLQVRQNGVMNKKLIPMLSFDTQVRQHPKYL